MKYEDDTPVYPIEEARKRYKDNNRSRTFNDHSLLVASCCLALKEANKAISGKAGYTWMPEAEYIDPEHDYHFLAEHEILRPNLCIVKKNKSGEIIANYLLEVFDASLPRYRIRYLP